MTEKYICDGCGTGVKNKFDKKSRNIPDWAEVTIKTNHGLTGRVDTVLDFCPDCREDLAIVTESKVWTGDEEES